MIQANELRIGNYIYEDYSGEMVVDLINEKYIDLYKLGFKAVGRFSIDYLKPIKLTKQWLTEFGFNKCFETCFELNGFILNENFILMDIDITIKLDYVHQLQNLYFALTKNELKL
jgi:hypothetical protein